jgi:histidine kinase
MVGAINLGKFKVPFYIEFGFFGLIIILAVLVSIPILIITVIVTLRRMRRSQKLLSELGANYLLDPRTISRTEKNYLDFMRFISHETSNPLQSIIGGLANLRQVIDSPDQRKGYLDQIEIEALRLTRLTADLRLLVQLENPTAQISKQAVQMRAVIASVIMSVADQATDMGIDLTYHGPDRPPRVLANREWLTRVIENLIDNCLKYRSPLSQEIIISLVPNEDDLMVSVSDDGVGISTDLLPQIFDQAYRVPDARTRKKPGSGLGLAIVKRIIEFHNGRIEIKSQYGQGTTVSFSLPLVIQSDLE